MRVAFLAHNFPRHPGDVAGHFLLPLARALVSRGVGVSVVAPSDGGRGGSDVVEGIPVRRVRYGSPAEECLAYGGAFAARARTPRGFRSFLRLLDAMRAGARAELADGADLVHAHWWVPAGLASPRGAPLVLTVHGTDGALLGRSWLARRLARPVFRRAAAVTTVSGHLARLVSSGTGRAPGGIEVIPMPVTLPPAIDRPRQGLVVLSRLVPQKRIGMALEALASLRATGPAERLTIVGDGAERGRLEAQAARLGLGSTVRFVGAVPPAEVHAHLAAARVALFPARAEGFGLVAAEALAAGTPVICCRDGGGVLDVLATEGAGVIVDPTGAAIADGVRALLAEPTANARAAAAGEAWRRRLDPDRVAERFEAVYRAALGG